jgi:hypothetical protein
MAGAKRDARLFYVFKRYPKVGPEVGPAFKAHYILDNSRFLD